MTAWRFCCCPSCREVYRSGAFACLDYGARWGHQMPARRQCPGCGHVAPTWRFHVVREQHADEDRREVSA